MIYQCKFGAIVQWSVRMWRSKHDLSVQIWSHRSVVSKMWSSKHDSSVQIWSHSSVVSKDVEFKK